MPRRVIAFALPLMLLSNVALAADDDCPAGSYQKSENGYTWCQPTVCINDTQCNPGQVCRQYGLCLQIGEIAEAGSPAADGGARIYATQICAPEKRCPQLQTCSTMGRCFTPAVADRLGLLTPAGTTPPDAPKKSSCGCSAVGADNVKRDNALALAGLGLAISALRARARRRAR